MLSAVTSRLRSSQTIAKVHTRTKRYCFFITILVVTSTKSIKLSFSTTPHTLSLVFGRPFVKRFALCHQTVVCLSCPVCPVSLSVLFILSVAFVHCGQTVGRIKMKLGMPVGFGPGHTVLGGEPPPAPPKGHSPPIFGQYRLRPWLHVSRCHSAWS